jgi:site-specific DNA recombinase
VAHQQAKTNYLEAGVRLLELAQVAYELYVSQDPRGPRELVDVVLSNCSLNGGTVASDLRKPFDLLVDAHEIQIWRGDQPCSMARSA